MAKKIRLTVSEDDGAPIFDKTLESADNIHANVLAFMELSQEAKTVFGNLQHKRKTDADNTP